MTVKGLRDALWRLPGDAEVLAMEAGCEEYCEREVDEAEWQGGRVYLHLGARRDEPPRWPISLARAAQPDRVRLAELA